jgi:DNA helicase II / ATP-dependent DNA helicase PcrA
MIMATVANPAEDAAVEALEKVFAAIDEGKNFRLEAGAGAGKTYTLVKALKQLIKSKGNILSKRNQRIACITYTNVAKEEIMARTDNHPVVLSETIHAFCWDLVKDFQNAIRQHIPNLSEKWRERVDDAGGLGDRTVSYSLGFPKITESEILLHHDDVIKLMVHLLADRKFRRIVTSRFPIILIDEYQDTDKDLALALVAHFIEPEEGPMIGLFGDHWQKIYGSSSCGLIEASVGKMEIIGKNANFRSDRLIVETLNRIRPSLPQHPVDLNSTGEIKIFHSNSWSGTRRSGGHWAGDLPEDDAHLYLEATKKLLSENGWELSPEKTKILMLTNNVIAAEQGYSGIAAAAKTPDDYLRKGDDYIAFLLEVVELGCSYFEKGEFGEMFKAFKIKAPEIKQHSDKAVWSQEMQRLLELRQNGTIGEVIEFLKTSKKPALPSKLEQKEAKCVNISNTPEENREQKDIEFLEHLNKVKAVPFSELTALSKYIDDKTIFSTKHGVKGAEFENVLVVCGRGWSHYNWSQMLEWEINGIPRGKEDTFERSRNLFYVACSRPQKKLALLFTQELSLPAISALKKWFGADTILPLTVN